MDEKTTKMLEDVLKQISTAGGDPKAAEAVKNAAAHAEKVVRDLHATEEEELRAALKKAADTRPLDLCKFPPHVFMMKNCSGPHCTVGCGTGCIVGCLIGGGTLVGFGAAGGSVGGAGTSIAISKV